MNCVSMEMGSLIEELQRAQHDLDVAADNGAFESQRPLVRVLKIELLNQIKTVSEHMRQLRWLVSQMLSNDSGNNAAPEVGVPRIVGNASLVEQVDAIVTAALGDKPLLRP